MHIFSVLNQYSEQFFWNSEQLRIGIQAGIDVMSIGQQVLLQQFGAVIQIEVEW